MTRKKWLSIIICFAVIFLIISNLLTYIIDPFFQFRYRDSQYMINCTFTAPGLIKTYDYNTILIGSSMSQNFDMDLFKSKLNCSPLKIGIGGMSDDDLVEYVQLANKVGKASTYYLCIDISGFASHAETKTVKYLMKDDLLSRMEYALSYESWFRFMPIDIAFMALIKSGHPLPSSYDNRVKIDRFGYCGDQYTYGEDIVLNGRKNGTNKVSDVDTSDLYSRMKEGIDDFFDELDLTNADYNFYFPPYSSLFWCDAQEAGYFDVYLDAKEYFIKKAEENGAKVYDFQDAEFTQDLDNYKDATHYAPKINDWMTGCFASGDHEVISTTYSECRERIEKNTDTFRAAHLELFK